MDDIGLAREEPMERFKSTHDSLECLLALGIPFDEQINIYHEHPEHIRSSSPKCEQLPSASVCTRSQEAFRPNNSSRSDHLAPPSEGQCPSLSSGTQSYDEEPQRYDATSPPKRSAARPRKLPDRSYGSSSHPAQLLDKVNVQPKLEVPIYASVRKILSPNHEYAERVIFAIEKLPVHKQRALHSINHDTQISQSPEKQSDPIHGSSISYSPSSSSSSNISPAGSEQEKAKASATSLGSSSGRLGKKRNSDRIGASDGDDSGVEDDDAPAAKQLKTDLRWDCPYNQAFPHMIYNARFTACKPPTNMKTRNDWSTHLRRLHSPEAKQKARDDSNNLFYMDSNQWTEVKSVIENAGLQRPRDPEGKLKGHNSCYLEVWDILFPQSRFSHLDKPVSAFCSDLPERSSLQDQSRFMFEAMFAARARMAVEAGLINTEADFRPSHQEYMEMVPEAFTVVASMVPETSKSIMESTPEALRDVATKFVGGCGRPHADDQFSRSRATTDGPFIANQPDSYVGNMNNCPSNTPKSKSLADAQASSQTVIPVSLKGGCTEVCVQVSVPPGGTSETGPELWVAIPAAASLTSFNQRQIVTRLPDQQLSASQPMEEDNAILSSHQPPLQQHYEPQQQFWDVDPSTITQGVTTMMPIPAKTEPLLGLENIDKDTAGWLDEFVSLEQTL